MNPDLLALEVSDTHWRDGGEFLASAVQSSEDERIRMRFAMGPAGLTRERRLELADTLHAASLTLRARLPRDVRSLYPRFARLGTPAGPVGVSTPIIMDVNKATPLRVWRPVLSRPAWMAGYASLLDGFALWLEDVE